MCITNQMYYCSGGNDGSFTSEMEYVTTSTQGNAAYFGNLSAAKQTPYGASAIRGVFSHGIEPAIRC